MRTSWPGILTGALNCALLAGCWGLGPTQVLFFIGSQPFMYEGEAMKLTNMSASDPELGLTVLTRNLTTQGTREQQVTSSRQEAFSLRLDAATIPDLASGPALVPVQLSVSAKGQAPQWSGLLQGTPKAWQQEARFNVVRDRDARLPPVHAATTSISRPQAGTLGTWVLVEDASLMEDVAIASAQSWGGRSLQVSKEPATTAQIASLPGAGDYIPPVEFYWYEVAGAFPKHVVPASFSGADADAVGVPKAVRVLLPRIRQPYPLRIEVRL